MKAFLVKLFEFCLKIVNESFIKYVNWNFYILGKFGASSPERERKLLSLAESGPSTRKTTKVSKSKNNLYQELPEIDYSTFNFLLLIFFLSIRFPSRVTV